MSLKATVMILSGPFELDSMFLETISVCDSLVNDIPPPSASSWKDTKAVLRKRSPPCGSPWFSSVQLPSCDQLCDPMDCSMPGLCPSPTPEVYSNSCLLSPWCHPTISSSVVPSSFHLRPFPASGSFAASQFFASGGQSIGVSPSAPVLPMNTQDWFPLGWTGWVSLLSKGFSRVFSNTTFQKHQFFCDQLSL